jgi:hypothetical protein
MVDQEAIYGQRGHASEGKTANWLALHRGCKFKAIHMWQSKEAQELDGVASTGWM